MSRRIITGKDVQSLPEGALLDLPEEALVTDIAREWIQKKRIRIVPTGKSAAKKLAKVRVALMRQVGGEKIGVKAAGGVRDAATLGKMVKAGATRIGAAAGVRIVTALSPSAARSHQTSRGD